MKQKAEEGDLRLEETEKERKNRPEKTEKMGSAPTGEKHQQFSQQERHT